MTINNNDPTPLEKALAQNLIELDKKIQSDPVIKQAIRATLEKMATLYPEQEPPSTKENR
jgi:hypothetical protein